MGKYPRRGLRRDGLGAEGTLQGARRHPAETEPSHGSNWRLNMKMVKSLLLGSAAGLVVVGGAQAADLPVKAAPVQYVKICNLYGAGFFYIPGTDMCLNVGGWVAPAIMGYYTGSTTTPWAAEQTHT